MSWFWMNAPLAVVFFAACSGIPLYMVLKHPTWGSRPADSEERMAPLPEAEIHHHVLAPALEVDARS
jgi:hypothetical protein